MIHYTTHEGFITCRRRITEQDNKKTVLKFKIRENVMQSINHRSFEKANCSSGIMDFLECSKLNLVVFNAAETQFCTQKIE